MTLLRVGELAKKCKIPTGRIRYYEQMGLIPKPERTESGYRQYPQEMVERISLIQRMKDLGFTLREIRTLLGMMNDQEGDSHDIQQFTENKLDEIQHKMEDLKKIQSLLLDLQQQCPGQGDLSECPIIEFVITPTPKEEKHMAEEKRIYNVKGMHCEGCETRVKKVLSQLQGITGVQADHAEGKVELQLSDDVSDKEIRKKIKDLGFKVRGGARS